KLVSGAVIDMYLSKSNFIFPCSAPTNGQERAMKKHMLKYIWKRSTASCLANLVYMYCGARWEHESSVANFDLGSKSEICDRTPFLRRSLPRPILTVHNVTSPLELGGVPELSCGP